MSSPCLTSLQLTLAAKSPPLLAVLLCGSHHFPTRHQRDKFPLPCQGPACWHRACGCWWGRNPPCWKLGKQHHSWFPPGRTGSKGRQPFHHAWQILLNPLPGPCWNLPVLTCLCVSLGRWTGKHKADPSSFLHGENFQHIIVWGLFDAWCKMQLNKTT